MLHMLHMLPVTRMMSSSTVTLGQSRWPQSVQSLRLSGLTANPKKCAVEQREVEYLDYHLGGWQVHPQGEKTTAIASWPQPRPICFQNEGVYQAQANRSVFPMYLMSNGTTGYL